MWKVPSGATHVTVSPSCTACTRQAGRPAASRSGHIGATAAVTAEITAAVTMYQPRSRRGSPRGGGGSFQGRM